MEYDDKIRSKLGLVACLRDMGNGKSRIFLDDVKSDCQEIPIKWQHEHFYTFSPELDNQKIEIMDLTDKQFQDIGVAVVARLLALNGRVK